MKSILAAEKDPLAFVFYEAVKYCLDHDAPKFYTQADLRKVMQLDALQPEVLWIHGTALLKMDRVAEVMKDLMTKHEAPEGLQ